MSTKFPAMTDYAERVIGFDWVDWLPDGVGLSSVAWESFPSGLTFTQSGISGTTTSVKVSGVSEDQKYIISAKAVFSDGQKEEISAPLYGVAYKLVP